MDLSTIDVSDRTAVNACLASQTSWLRSLTQQSKLTATAVQSLAQRAADLYNFASVNSDKLQPEQFANFKALACDALSASFQSHAQDLTAEEFAALLKFSARAGRAFKDLSELTAKKYFLAAHQCWKNATEKYSDSFSKLQVQTIFEMLVDELEMATKNSISENEAFRFANEIKELLDADALSNSRLEISRRFFNFGVRCFKQQSWEPAVRWTKLSLSIPQPQLEVSADASQREARSYRMLALCFKELRLVEQALSSVEKAVLLDEENVDNWFLSIELLAIAQRFHDAEIAVASMTKLSDLTITQAFLICSLLAQFDSELALRCLLLVSIRFPGDESIMLEHFRILLKASRLADALLIVQQRAGMSDRSSLSGDFIALVWDVIASRWVAKSLPECEAWLLAFHFLVSGSKFEAELARAGRALSLLYFETQKYEASLKYALEARLREPSAAASFMALRAQLHLGMVEDALKMFQVLLASPDFDKKLLLSIVIHSNNTACRQILIQAIQAILVHPEFAVDILPLNQMLLARTAIVSLLDASISDESLPSYAQSDQSSVSDQEKRITLALEFVQLGLIAARRARLLYLANQLPSSEQDEKHLSKQLWDEMKWLFEASWNIAIESGESHILLSCKTAFESSKHLVDMLIADSALVNLPSHDRDDLISRAKFASLLAASAALELATSRSSENNKLVTEALSSISECTQMCGAATDKLQAMLFVMEVKARIYQGDPSIESFTKKAVNIPSVTSELLEACAQFALLPEFRNLDTCIACLETALTIVLAQIPIPFSKLPSLFHQLLVFHTKSPQSQEALLQRIDALLSDSLTRRPFCEAFSESEAQAIVSIVWNHGVALFRSSKLADSQRQMKRAIQLMRMLLPNKFEKKLAEMENNVAHLAAALEENAMEG